MSRKCCRIYFLLPEVKYTVRALLFESPIKGPQLRHDNFDLYWKVCCKFYSIDIIKEPVLRTFWVNLQFFSVPLVINIVFVSLTFHFHLIFIAFITNTLNYYTQKCKNAKNASSYRSLPLKLRSTEILPSLIFRLERIAS